MPRTQEGYPSSRLTLSQIIELLLHRSSVERSSVSLSRNAKGETQIEVVVRTGDTSKVQTVADAADEAIRIYDQLRSKYPLASGLTSATPTR